MLPSAWIVEERQTMGAKQPKSIDTRRALMRRLAEPRPTTPPAAVLSRAIVAQLVYSGADCAGEALAQPTMSEADACALLSFLPDPGDWNGRPDLPWGFPGGGGRLSEQLLPTRAGRTGCYLQYEQDLYDSIRDAFVAVRLNAQPNRARVPQAGACRVIDPVAARATAAVAINFDAQLELLRRVLRIVVISGPLIDMGRLAENAFDGQLTFAEHYLWRLERDGMVAGAAEGGSLLVLTAEGCATLIMLELTTAAIIDSPISPAAMLDVAERTGLGNRAAQTSNRPTDIPRFLTRQK